MQYVIVLMQYGMPLSDLSTQRGKQCVRSKEVVVIGSFPDETTEDLAVPVCIHV